MKLIKAFVRTTRVDEVVRALEDAGAPGITISRVHGVGYGYEPLLFTLAPSEYHKTLEVSKIEVVCCAPEADCLIETVAKAARTGVEGDGIVFVTPVERAIKIRTGVEGPQILKESGGDS
jgi:nitrogen regulatory protein P-II 1